MMTVVGVVCIALVSVANGGYLTSDLWVRMRLLWVSTWPKGMGFRGGLPSPYTTSLGHHINIIYDIPELEHLPDFLRLPQGELQVPDCLLALLRTHAGQCVRVPRVERPKLVPLPHLHVIVVQDDLPCAPYGRMWVLSPHKCMPL